MSKIRLYGDTSGYVDISAPAVADNRNIDLPGVLDSKLDIAGGKILQIVSATHSTDVTTTATSFVDSGLTASITPTSNTSKVLIMSAMSIMNYVGSGILTEVEVNLVRGSTQINSHRPYLRIAASNIEIQNHFMVTQVVLDSPATTSSTTYKVQGRKVSGFQITMNLTGSTSSMILMEISA